MATNEQLTTTGAPLVDERTAREFLAGHRIAVVGASPDRDSFGATIARALRGHGTDVVVVNRACRPVDDLPCYHDVASVPGDLDGVVVVVAPAAAAEVVRACAAEGIRRVWLFKGIGGPGSATPEAIAAAQAAGIELVAGACPLMFLEPVGWAHRAHRWIRRRRGALRTGGG